MTKLNSKLFNACTKRQRGAQPEHSIQHDRERGSEHKHRSGTSSVLPAPALQAIPPKGNYRVRVLTDRAIASISMDTQLWEHCSYDHTNDGDLGKPLSRGLEPAQSAGRRGRGPSAAPSPPLGVPLPPRAQRPGPARGISRVKNQPHGQGHGEPPGLSLKTGFHRLHRHEGDAMQPAHGPARLRPAWFVCWPGCCAKTP